METARPAGWPHRPEIPGTTCGNGSKAVNIDRRYTMIPSHRADQQPRRRSDRWNVPCHDAQGHRTILRIELAENGVTITPSTAGRSDLAPLQVGQLRAALREAIIALDEMQHSDREYSRQHRRHRQHRRKSASGRASKLESRMRMALRSLRHALALTSTGSNGAAP